MNGLHKNEFNIQTELCDLEGKAVFTIIAIVRTHNSDNDRGVDIQTKIIC